MHMVAAAGMGRYMRMVVGGYMGKVAWMGGGIFALRRPRPYSRNWRAYCCEVCRASAGGWATRANW